jgi:hypothetical protein
MRVYNEKSGIEFEAWFETEPGVPTVPSSVHWKLLDVNTDTTLQDWTAVVAVIESDETGITGVRSTIDVSGQLNVMTDTSKTRELKRVLIVADKDSAREYSQERDYYVKKVGRG